ncbi:hypothetical protein FQN57_001089 [Myotisia sp. PD_48]|nr:hypothetical protein FQN57_001089 [Myotisia sp. PD_48]
MILGSLARGRMVAAGAAVAFGLALRPIETANAEAPSQYSRSSKKPMYDVDDEDKSKILRQIEKPADSESNQRPQQPESSESTPSLLTEQLRSGSRTPTDQLAEQIRHARLFLYRHSLSAENSFNDTVSRILQAESRFTQTIASLAPPRESGERLMPGSVYVAVTAMAGSIVSRNRGILLRTASPLAVGTVAAWTLLPVTMRNVSDLIWEYEKKVPALAEQHLKIRSAAENIWYTAVAHSGYPRILLENKIGEGRLALEQWVGKQK